MKKYMQFIVERQGGEKQEIQSTLEFSRDEATGDFSTGGTYKAENSIESIEAIYRRPAIFRVYTRQYEQDGPVYVFPINHIRVDYDDPNVYDDYGHVADPDDPFWPGGRLVESRTKELVAIVAEFKLGYDNPTYHGNNPEGFITVKGLNSDLEPSGKEYVVEWTRFYELGRWTWALEMPKEPVLVEASTTELTTYVGREFVGTYDCYYIPWGVEYASTVTVATQADANLELNANTLFTLKSTDGSRVPGYTYDNQGLYAFNDEYSMISYDMESCKDAQGRDKDGIGIQGDYTEGAWMMTAVDTEDGGLDDTYRHFFSVKQSAGVAGIKVASNQNGNRFLIEATTADGKEYWYWDAPVGEKSFTRVEANFEGKSIDEEGADAKIMGADDVVLFRYIYADGKPVFQTIGSEAGTYTDSASEGGELVLDGFGEGTYEGQAGTYTIDDAGMTVTFTPAEGGEEVKFIIYKDTMTYSKQQAEAGTLEGTFSTADGSYSYTMRVTVNTDGTADFYFANGSNVYHDEHGITCVYDSDAKKLTLSGFMMAVPGAWSQSSLRTVDFTVSDDMASLTCTTAEIQHKTQGPSTKIAISGTILTKE